MNRVTIRILLVLVTLLVSATCFAQIECVRCRGDAVTCNGEQGSAEAGTPCPDACVCGLRTRLAYFDTPQPGVLLAQRNGKLIVSTVLPGSPASAAGIRIGDELVRINGLPPFGRDCGLSGWASSQDPATSILMMRRDRETPKSIVVSLQTIRQYMDGNWVSPGEGNGLRLARQNSAKMRWSGGFTIGIQVAHRRDGLVVTSVLKGSPAFSAGFSPGDIISRVNANNARDVGSERIENPKTKETIVLTLRSGAKTRNVRLNAISLTDVLEQIGKSETSPKRETLL